MEEKERGLWLPIKCESGTSPPLARLGLGRKNGPRPYCGPRAERGGGGATATCGGKAAVVEAK